MKKEILKNIYNELSKTKNGKVKAVEEYGTKGIVLLAYLYTETRTKMTEEYINQLKVVTGTKKEDFDFVFEEVKKLYKKEVK